MPIRGPSREAEEAGYVAVEAASHRGVRSFRASYIPTKKNGVISNLYPSLGFARMEQTVPTDGATRWYLNLADYEYRPTHIARTSK